MNRNEFEQLLSEWFDEPTRPDLLARIDSAAAENLNFALIRDAWMRLNVWTRDASAEQSRAIDGIDWAACRSRLESAAHASLSATATPSDEDRMDQFFRDPVPVVLTVDWTAFHARVMAGVSKSSKDGASEDADVDQLFTGPDSAVAGIDFADFRQKAASRIQRERVSASPPRILFLNRRALIGTGTFAAAAALVFAMWPRAGVVTPLVPTPRIAVTVSSPWDQSASNATAVAHVSVSVAVTDGDPDDDDGMDVAGVYDFVNLDGAAPSPRQSVDSDIYN